MKKAYFSVVFYPQQEGGFTVVCPEVEGCISEGNTYEEALTNIKSLIKSMVKDKENYNDEDFIKSIAVPNKLFTELEVEY